jgi:guanine deaminase
MTAETFMQRANALALEKMHENMGGPFGAVIVRDGLIVAEGWNRVTSENDPTAHAEIVAIRAACSRLRTFDLSGCEIYGNCEPCPMCLGAIYWARMARIYYSHTRADAARIGFDDAMIYGELVLPAEKRKIPAIQIVTPNARLAFDEWVRSPEKTRY